jgi:hypothetical protein
VRVRGRRRAGVQASGGLQWGGGQDEEDEEEKEEREEEEEEEEEEDEKEEEERLAARHVRSHGMCLNSTLKLNP